MKTVLIDFGHCSQTPGKRSFDGTFREYEFNQDVGTRIVNHLKRHGINAIGQQINNANPTVELNTRIKEINRLKPDLVVSIHANAAGTTWNSANGWEIFCYQPNLSNSQSYKLAKCIHEISIPSLGLRDRGIKDANGIAGIVMNTSAIAVLIEHGFYTNQAECGLLKTAAFREKCAVADAKGILAYLNIAWKEENTMEEKKPHWAEKNLDNLVKKGLINSPEAHINTLDEPLTKGQVFALLDRITDK